jgi:thiamine-monophosphate kinase
METLSDVGERELIRMAASIYHEHQPLSDFTDDCAIIPINEDYLLASSDMISEKTHVPQGMNPWQIGWFITAINLSDIAAKGGKPLGLLLSLGMPKTYPTSSFLDVIKGASSCATKYNTAIIGGDTKEHNSLSISGTALGKVKKDLFMSRKGIQADDMVLVTGSLGKAAAGYHLLQQQKTLGNVNALCEPSPRVNEGITLAETKLVHCCMDLSDGLSSSLYQLTELNQVGFEIYQDTLPISPQLKECALFDSTIDGLSLSLHFGGDYELLFTASENDISTIQNELSMIGTKVTVIGKVVSDKNEVVLKKPNGFRDQLPNLGYEHFKER